MYRTPGAKRARSVIAAIYAVTAFAAVAIQAARFATPDPVSGLLVFHPLSIIVLVVFLAVFRPFCIGVHELGHLMCCLVLRVEVRSFSAAVLPFPPVLPFRARFRIAGVSVNLGYGALGLVQYTGVEATGWRAMLITAAGPGANLAAVCAAVGVILTASSPVAQSAGYGFAIVSAGYFAANLVPAPSRHGDLSDGGKLFLGPVIRKAMRDVRALASDPGWNAPDSDAGARLLAASRIRVPFAPVGAGIATLAALIREQERTDDLLAMHRAVGRLWVVVPSKVRDAALAVHAVEWPVLLLPDLPENVVNEATEHIRSVLRYVEDGDPSRSAVEHTLALAYLRQGRFSDVEPFCRSGLQDLDGKVAPRERATVLATIVLARKALGQPYQDVLDEALQLAPDADLVAEANGVLYQDGSLNLREEKASFAVLAG